LKNWKLAIVREGRRKRRRSSVDGKRVVRAFEKIIAAYVFYKQNKSTGFTDEESQLNVVGF
jgi:hypothetical protein